VLDADSNQVSLEQLSGAGELTHALTALGLVDEFWFWVSPSLWPAGPRIFDGVGPVRLHLAASTAYPSGVLWLRYRPSPDQQNTPSGS
jgi:dihydrofolate reductase